MAWVKLTDVFPEDPKIEQLSDRAFRLHITALCHCARNLTDGRLTEKAVKTCAVSAGISHVSRVVSELKQAELWAQNGSADWLIPKYLDYNPSAEEVRERREKRADAGRQGAKKRWQTP